MPRIRITYSDEFPEDLIEHSVTTDLLGWATSVQRDGDRVLVAELTGPSYEVAKPQLAAWQADGCRPPRRRAPARRGIPHAGRARAATPLSKGGSWCRRDRPQAALRSRQESRARPHRRSRSSVGPGSPADARVVHGDRTVRSDLDRLAQMGPWDAVVDVPGVIPAQVRDAARCFSRLPEPQASRGVAGHSQPLSISVSLTLAVPRIAAIVRFVLG